MKHVDQFLLNVEKQRERFFPEAPLVVLEHFPFYGKVRINLDRDLFIEIRYNRNNQRSSYVLVENGKRVAGFDNLGGWHMHPKENPHAHRKVSVPTLDYIFVYFADMV